MPSVETMKSKSKGNGKIGNKVATKTTKSSSKSDFVLREDCFRVLNDKNEADPKVEPKLSKEVLIRMYRNMVLTRVLDERGMMLQRQGRTGFYVPSFGQEAVQTGTVSALEKADWIFPSYREPGVFLYRGADLFLMLCNLFGNRQDVCKGRQMPNHYSFAKERLFSVSSPIATQVIQAVGAAMAARIKKENDIAMTYFGDGGTSENDFHTGLTFAGAYKAPVVFVCTNNQYAISVPFEKQCGAKRIADKGIGYGMPGVAVDGNDILAVYKVAKEAVDRARSGQGPTLIEALTLRMGPHSAADDPTRYRNQKQFEAWQKRDPIVRFKEYLEKKKLWDSKKDAALLEEVKSELADAVERAEKVPPPEIEDIFNDVYAELTPQLQRQLEQLKKDLELIGKFENTSEAFPL